MTQSRNKITLFFGVLTAIFLLLAVSALVLLRANQDNLRQHSYDESGFAALQVRLHYEMLLGKLVAWESGVTNVTVDDAVVAFDILYERVESLPTRPTYDKLLDEESLGLQRELLAALTSELPKIDAAAEGDGAQLRGMYGRLLPLARKAERLGHHPVQVASERRAQATFEYERLTDLFSWVVMGFIVLGFIFAAIILRQLKHMQELSAHLRRTRDEAEAASAAKSKFLSHMSHEFRTPMNAILGFAQLLEMNELDASQNQAVKQILTSGNSMLSLIDQVLELDHIIVGDVAMSLGNVDCNTLLQECKEMVEGQAERLNVQVDVRALSSDFPDKIVTDYMRLQQVLFCLFSNAINYNRPNGHVYIGCERISKGRIQFSVRDTGVGIPIDRQDGIFQPFNRLGRESQAIQGTGVGLTIAHELVKLLKGTIHFESVPGQGSTFWVSLPIKWQG